MFTIASLPELIFNIINYLNLDDIKNLLTLNTFCNNIVEDYIPLHYSIDLRKYKNIDNTNINKIRFIHNYQGENITSLINLNVIKFHKNYDGTNCKNNINANSNLKCIIYRTKQQNHTINHWLLQR